jgi:hypothetical protein
MIIFLSSCKNNKENIQINKNTKVFIDNQQINFPIQLNQFLNNNFEYTNDIIPLEDNNLFGLKLDKNNGFMEVWLKNENPEKVKKKSDYEIIYINIKNNQNIKVEVDDITFDTSYDDLLKKLNLDKKTKTDKITINDKNKTIEFNIKNKKINSINIIKAVNN